MAFQQIILLVLKLLYADTLFDEEISTDKFTCLDHIIC